MLNQDISEGSIFKDPSSDNDFLLSIITINKNNASGLVRTLKSLSDFSKDKQIEFIFVDGASTDDSVDIARHFYESDNFISEPDRGVYHAMNKGLKLARGKYVIWLNSGDELLPDCIGVIKKILISRSAALISFGLNLVSEDSTAPPQPYFPKLSDLPLKTLPHQSTFFLRKAISEINGYSEYYRVASDRDAILKLFFAKKEILIFKKIISNYYLGGLSASCQVNFDNFSIDRKYGLISNYKYCRLVYGMRRWRGAGIIIKDFCAMR